MVDTQVDDALHGDDPAETDGGAGDEEVDGVDHNADATDDTVVGNTAIDQDQTPADEEDESGSGLQTSYTHSELGRGVGSPGEESGGAGNGADGINNDDLYRRVRELALDSINTVRG